MAKIINYQIDMASINQKVAQSAKYNKAADALARQKLLMAKTQLLNEFDNHPVTQEIKGGPNQNNLSNTLGGYGNLFTFIGFPEGADPTDAVRSFLMTFIRITKKTKDRNLNINYSVSIPDQQDFNFAKMPWESGKNWVSGIESGISGFNYYLSKAAQASRSGGAIQVDGNLRSVNSSAGIQYMSKIIENFKERMMT